MEITWGLYGIEWVSVEIQWGVDGIFLGMCPQFGSHNQMVTFGYIWGPHLGAPSIPSYVATRQFLSTVVLSYWILIAAQAVGVKYYRVLSIVVGEWDDTDETYWFGHVWNMTGWFSMSLIWEIWDVIIPIDEVIFFKMVKSPPTSHIYLL